MKTNFRTVTLTDDERRAQAANWIGSGIEDLKRAVALLDGRAACRDVRLLIANAEIAADAIRTQPDAITPTV